MTNQDIFALMDRFERSTLQSMRVSTGEYQIEFQKGALAAPTAAGAVVPPAAEHMPGPAAVAAGEPEGPVIAAPLVGTFYAAPAPGAAPFVQIGGQVKKGETLCLIEAMKTMNEVPAPCDLIVEELLAADGELVGFDAPLMRCRYV